MKFAIADPPYLGRAKIWYGQKMRKSQKGIKFGGTSKVNYKPADFNENAEIWDNIKTHKNLIEKLENEYDGFALCMAHDNLQKLLPFCKPNIKIMIWHKWSIPSRSRIQNRFEPVLIRIPKSLKGAVKGQTMPDVLTWQMRTKSDFAGAKPKEWTYWVLDAMGVDKDDEIEDLFIGSGAVTQAINDYKKERFN